MQIMDTPMTEQIRPGQPDSEEATDEDCLELMEMILGALGRDALGLGSSIAHPKESEEWKGMTVSCVVDRMERGHGFCVFASRHTSGVAATGVTPWH